MATEVTIKEWEAKEVDVGASGAIIEGEEEIVGKNGVSSVIYHYPEKGPGTHYVDITKNGKTYRFLKFEAVIM